MDIILLLDQYLLVKHKMASISYHYIMEYREKEGDLTQSYDKTPIPTENSKTKGQHTNATKNFDFTTIADRLRTISCKFLEQQVIQLVWLK